MSDYTVISENRFHKVKHIVVLQRLFTTMARKTFLPIVNYCPLQGASLLGCPQIHTFPGSMPSFDEPL